MDEKLTRLFECIQDYVNRKEIIHVVKHINGGKRIVKYISAHSRCALNGMEHTLTPYDDGCLIKIGISFLVTKQAFDDVQEFITRANYGLIWGCFELDRRDGEISYRLLAPCNDLGYISFELLDNAIITAVSTVIKYSDSLVKVAFGYLEAEEAVELAERNSISASDDSDIEELERILNDSDDDVEL